MNMKYHFKNKLFKVTFIVFEKLISRFTVSGILGVKKTKQIYKKMKLTKLLNPGGVWPRMQATVCAPIKTHALQYTYWVYHTHPFPCSDDSPWSVGIVSERLTDFASLSVICRLLLRCWALSFDARTRGALSACLEKAGVCIRVLTIYVTYIKQKVRVCVISPPVFGSVFG